MADADRAALVRRVYFDLIGLPPSPEDVVAFVQDASPGAFEKVVDRLLASPRFGERWGRHWLDVARFAESSGKERNFTFPEAWRYRDWVIAAFNAARLLGYQRGGLDIAGISQSLHLDRRGDDHPRSRVLYLPRE